MSTEAEAGLPFPARGGRPALLVGLALACGLLWAYWPTLVGLVQRWSSDPQYTHGYVIPVFALIVLWFRRSDFPANLRPSWWGLVVVAVAVVLRLLGAALFIDWLDAGSLLPALAGLIVLAGGWALLGWSWPALAFLLFVVPLPYQADILLAHPLRSIATVCSTYGLQTLGIPALADGNVIIIDDLKVGVVEACSGLGMLMTFFALSTAVAFVVRRPLIDRGIIFVSAVPIGVLMNVLRITVTVFCFRFADAEVAKVVFHDVAGWIMMPLALGVLWLELLFLERLRIPLEKNTPVPVPVDPIPAPGRIEGYPTPRFPGRKSGPRRTLPAPVDQPDRSSAEPQSPTEAPELHYQPVSNDTCAAATGGPDVAP